MVKLCIFDMDGLLIDSERTMWSPSMAKAVKKQGFELTLELHNTYRGMSFEGVRHVLGNVFGPTFDYDLFLKDVWEENEHIIEAGIPLRPGVRDLLNYLHEHNIKTCIGTTTPHTTCEKILNVIGIKDEFDQIVCGDEVSKGKPDPEIYLTCLSKFDVNKNEALVFEDGQAGSEAAIAAGIRLIVVPDLAHIDDDVLDKAYANIENISMAIELINKENKYD